jgi:hypothetical protein
VFKAARNGLKHGKFLFIGGKELGNNVAHVVCHLLDAGSGLFQIGARAILDQNAGHILVVVVVAIVVAVAAATTTTIAIPQQDTALFVKIGIDLLITGIGNVGPEIRRVVGLVSRSGTQGQAILAQVYVQGVDAHDIGANVKFASLQ